MKTAHTLTKNTEAGKLIFRVALKDGELDYCVEELFNNVRRYGITTSVLHVDLEGARQAYKARRAAGWTVAA